jgi:hypothetical protein
MTSLPNLRPLNAAVERAKAERFRPVQPGEEPRTIFPLVEYLDEPGERTTWRIVLELRKHEPALYNRFLGERYLRDVVVDIVAEQETPVDFPTLVQELERRADAADEWLIAVPLANFLVPRGYLCIEEGVAALKMTVQDPNWKPWGSSDPDADPFRLFHDLKDHMSEGVRWHREDPTGRLDTRTTAKLFLVQQGTETAALSVAMTKARLALAIWCLLDPPDPMSLWPATGEWQPRPYILDDVTYKLYEPGEWIGSARTLGRRSYQLGEYTITDQPEKLRAPFEMMRLAEAMIAPRAVASGAWALHLAEREPVDQERTDSLVHLRSAIEAICDTATGPTGEGDRRWARITERFGVWKKMRGVYGQRELEEAKQLTRDLRNITQHGSDDILVNLGYPPEAIRPMQDGRSLTGEQLGLARAAAAYPVLHRAVREVVSRLALDGITNGWDDQRFRQQFEASN